MHRSYCRVPIILVLFLSNMNFWTDFQKILKFHEYLSGRSCAFPCRHGLIDKMMLIVNFCSFASAPEKGGKNSLMLRCALFILDTEPHVFNTVLPGAGEWQLCWQCLAHYVCQILLFRVLLHSSSHIWSGVRCSAHHMVGMEHFLSLLCGYLVYCLRYTLFSFRNFKVPYLRESSAPLNLMRTQ